MRDGVAQPFVALLWAIALERLAHGHFVHGPVHRGDDGGRQRFRHVADAAADESLGGVGIRVAKHFHAPADFGKQITGFEFQIIVVEQCHKIEGRDANEICCAVQANRVGQPASAWIAACPHRCAKKAVKGLPGWFLQSSGRAG